MDITAAVLRAADGPYALETVTLADPGPGQILVRIVGAGMCHTDVLPRAGVGHGTAADHRRPRGRRRRRGGRRRRQHRGRRRPRRAELRLVRRVRPVPRPVSRRTATRSSPRNLSGRELDGSTGVTDADGGEISSRWFGQSSFATHAIASERNTVVVDTSLPLELLGPLGCGIQTGAGSVLVAMDVQAGSSIVVFGAGAVGLAAVMAAKVAGATTIIAVDLQQHRLDLARELGATHVIAGGDDDVVEQIHAITGGGADYAFDTTGVPAVMRNALLALRMTGVCGLRRHPAGPARARGHRHRRQDGARHPRGLGRPADVHPPDDRAVAGRRLPVRPAHRDVPDERRSTRPSSRR